MKSRPPSSFARNIPGPIVAQSATGVVLAVGSGTVDVSMPGGEVHRRVPLAGGAPTVGARVTVTLLDGKPASAVGTRTMASAGGLVVLGSDTGGGGAGVYAPSPHALNSVHHTGTVADAQIPQLTTHAADPNAHHARAHAITSSSDHTVTGSTYQLVGLTGTNTLGLHTPASTVAANTIPIGGTGGAITWSGLQTLNAGATIATGQTLTTPAITAAANLTLNPAGDIIFDPTGNDLLPTTNYDLNLGAISKKYLTLHCAELWVETLVAQDTLATIGGRILVGPTTQLTSDLLAAGGAMYCKHNNLAIGDIVYMEAGGQLEFMRITAGPTGTGPYEYNMVRNLDGTGANNWYAGDALFNTGTTGDGFIDLYSLRSIKSATQYGPTIVGWGRNSATYNDITEKWAIGNLNGLYGVSADAYGVGLGDYAGGNYLLYDGSDFSINTGDNSVKLNSDGVSIVASTAEFPEITSSSKLSFVDASTSAERSFISPWNYSSVNGLQVVVNSIGTESSRILIQALGPNTISQAASVGLSAYRGSSVSLLLVASDDVYGDYCTFEGDYFLVTATNIALGGVVAIGEDTNIYRSAANQLKTDDALEVTGLTTAVGGVSVTGGRIYNTSTLSSGSYSFDALAASGADRSIARFGVTSVSNGFFISYTHSGTKMNYTFTGDTIRLTTARTPASSGAAGNAGDICWDASYIYVCTATDNWERAAIATW